MHDWSVLIMNIILMTAERDYEMNFWQQELVREIENLEEASQELKVNLF